MFLTCQLAMIGYLPIVTVTGSIESYVPGDEKAMILRRQSQTSHSNVVLLSSTCR